MVVIICDLSLSSVIEQKINTINKLVGIVVAINE